MTTEYHPTRHFCFEPIADQDAEILILGSLPGPESLAHQEYYKKTGNSFWRIIFALYGRPAAADYEEKRAFLLEHKIALWDVFHSASRIGAADTAIKNASVNDFPAFFAAHPRIGCILFNGSKAYTTFKKAYPDLLKQIPHRTVWSTSGACARPFAAKFANWRMAIDQLCLRNDDPEP